MEQSKRVLNCLKKTRKIFVLFLVSFLMTAFFSHSAYASDISISNSGKVSFGKVQPSSVGTLVTGEDSLSISTTCAEGVNVYATSVNGNDTGTNLVNLAAKAQDTEGTNAASYTINTSSATIGSAATLANNTWGLNTNASEVGNGLYYGLPAFSDSTTPTAIYTGTDSSIPVYFGAKVTNTLATGTYNGQVLYTATVNTACLNYTVTFDKNTESATGSMESQTILPAGGNLRANSFEYSGYTFLGWSTSPEGKTGTAVDGIGTEADVEYENEALFPDATTSPDIKPGDDVTLYAIWKKAAVYFQAFNSCHEIPEGTTGTLVDSRDNQEYTVYHIPSNATYPGTSTVANVVGKCIMTKDLNLGAVNSVPGSASTITANGTMTLSPEDSGFTTPTGSGESITVPTTSVSITNGSSSWSTTNSYSNKQYTTSGTGSYANRGYYSWGAAMVSCPKGWRLPTQDEYNNNDSSWNASTTGISKLVNNNISTIQSSPWSFVLGGVYNGSFNFAGLDGTYWSSAQYSSTYSYRLYLDSSSGLKRGSDSKYSGYSVRCIAEDYGDATGYMQDWATTEFGCSKLQPNEIVTLVDKRDGNSYTVKKFGTGADAECWMTQNLTLGYDQTNNVAKGLALTNANTNIPADNTTTYYLPPAGYQGSITSSSTMTSTTAASFSSSSNNQARVQYAAASQTGSTNPQPTGYYNFYAVSLGYSGYSTGASSGSTPRDICPKGWQLPRGSSTTTYSFYWLDVALGGTGANRTDTTTRDKFLNQASFSYTGYYGSSTLYNVGSGGYWWSSTISDRYNAYLLHLGSNGYVNPQGNDYKYLGFSVRCVDQNSNASGYMQDFDSSTLASNQVVSLVDKRDNHVYKVKKLPDGKVWMIQSLTLSATDLVTEGKALTSANTNIPSSDTNSYYVPPRNTRYATANSITNSAVATASSASVNFGSSYSNHPQVAYKAKGDTNHYASNPLPEDTAWYPFYTATLGFSYFGDGKTSGSSPRDICPKGWRLPWASDSGSTSTGTGDLYTLALSYNNSSSVWYNYITPGSSSLNGPYTSNATVRQNMIYGDSGSLDPTLEDNGAVGFTYVGYYDGTTLFDVGTRGSYWSSSVYDSDYGYSSGFNTSDVRPQGNSGKLFGLAVRCVTGS